MAVDRSIRIPRRLHHLFDCRGFSTASVQIAEMCLDGKWGKAIGYGQFLMAAYILVGSCLFAGLGMWIGGTL